MLPKLHSLICLMAKIPRKFGVPHILMFIKVIFVVNHVFSVIFFRCLRMTIFISGSCWIDGTAGNNQVVFNSICRVSNKVSPTVFETDCFCSISFNSSTCSSKIYYFCHCFLSIKLSTAFLGNLRGPNRSGGDLHLNPIYLGDICNSLLKISDLLRQ
jgi:hypothetical protein